VHYRTGFSLHEHVTELPKRGTPERESRLRASDRRNRGFNHDLCSRLILSRGTTPDLNAVGNGAVDREPSLEYQGRAGISLRSHGESLLVRSGILPVISSTNNMSRDRITLNLMDSPVAIERPAHYAKHGGLLCRDRKR
jgi:hypothetical protein